MFSRYSIHSLRRLCSLHGTPVELLNHRVNDDLDTRFHSQLQFGSLAYGLEQASISIRAFMGVMSLRMRSGSPCSALKVAEISGGG